MYVEVIRLIIMRVGLKHKTEYALEYSQYYMSITVADYQKAGHFFLKNKIKTF